MRDVSFDNFCRLENCSRPYVHTAHDRPYRGNRGSITIKSRHLIVESTLKAVSSRVLKPFSAIFVDVLDDYGDVKDRTVYRALAQLITRREIGLVVPPGSADKLRAGGFVRGGYIRMDSPLLMQNDGLLTLMDQAEELCLEMRSGGEVGRGCFGECDQIKPVADLADIHTTRMPTVFSEEAYELIA